MAELEPQAVWQHFDEILTIPRPSKGEEGMRRYVVRRAEARGFEVRRDAAGNVVVVVPATAGHEGVPTTVLQGHLDMVQEKNSDVEFDFSADAIRPLLDGDYLTADGTTLGADNGIGVAAMLALLDGASAGGDGPAPTHGPLELLFTIDEETGLTGAAELDGSIVSGRRLLNLDTEEEGSVYVGCAGGADSLLTLPVERTALSADSRALAIRVSGLKGGHSGVDIHLERGNAVALLARALWATHLDTPLRLVRFAGGSAHNAIPREASATVVVEVDAEAAARRALESEGAAIGVELATVDPGFSLGVEATATPDEAWDEATGERALALLVGLPHGVLAMSQAIHDLVETSNNVAVVTEADGALTVLTSTRSSVASALTAVRRRIAALARLAGAGVEQHAGYPGWKPDLDSPLLATVKAVHQRVLGREPEVKAIHAGLETGVLGEKLPGIDMVSIGPQIESPHSPDERVHIASVGRFWALLTAILAELTRATGRTP